MPDFHPNDSMPVSFSGLKQFAKSPAHFVHYKTSPFTSSLAMRRGTLVHRMVLEPDDISKMHVIDASTRSTKAFKEAERAHGEWACLQKEIDDAQAIADAVRSHKTASALLDKALNKEKHLKWTCEGLPMHGFPDAYGNGILLDLKVTNPHPSKFQRTVIDFQYHMQLALYAMAIDEPCELFWICVDPSAPHTVAVFEPSKEMIQDGVNAARLEARMFLNWCKSFNSNAPLLGFDHYDNGAPMTLHLPTWHK